MKVWITNYALSDGIFEVEAEICESVSKDMIKTKENYERFFHGEGKEWHRDKQSAIAKAEEMRKKKIAALKKQIEKLEKMKFD